MRYSARAPLRVDFGGGWTDVPTYAEEAGGAVLSAAITRYVRGHISRPESSGILHVVRGDRSYVSYGLDLPAGAGLGASAAQTVLWVTLVRTSVANTVERRQVADMACRVSAALGILGGKQDEYASALGGINFFTFDHEVRAEPVSLSPELKDHFLSRLVLVYSGQSRVSGSIHEHVWGRYAARDIATINALATLKRVAGDMKNTLMSGDFDSFGELLNENWTSQKTLHPSISTPVLDQIFELALRNGARGGKACGAGGGGCLVFLAKDGAIGTLRTALSSHKVKIIDFEFDQHGVRLTAP